MTKRGFLAGFSPAEDCSLTVLHPSKRANNTKPQTVDETRVKLNVLAVPGGCLKRSGHQQDISSHHKRAKRRAHLSPSRTLTHREIGPFAWRSPRALHKAGSLHDGSPMDVIMLPQAHEEDTPDHVTTTTGGSPKRQACEAGVDLLKSFDSLKLMPPPSFRSNPVFGMAYNNRQTSMRSFVRAVAPSYSTITPPSPAQQPGSTASTTEHTQPLPAAHTHSQMHRCAHSNTPMTSDTSTHQHRMCMSNNDIQLQAQHTRSSGHKSTHSGAQHHPHMVVGMDADGVTTQHRTAQLHYSNSLAHHFLNHTHVTSSAQPLGRCCSSSLTAPATLLLSRTANGAHGPKADHPYGCDMLLEK